MMHLQGTHARSISPAARASEPVDAHDLRAREALERGERKSALDTLMSAYGVPLYRYCYSILGSRALADDVHQTVFLQAYQALLSFEGTSFRSWLYEATENGRFRAHRATIRLARTSADQGAGGTVSGGTTQPARRQAQTRFWSVWEARNLPHSYPDATVIRLVASARRSHASSPRRPRKRRASGSTPLSAWALRHRTYVT